MAHWGRFRRRANSLRRYARDLDPAFGESVADGVHTGVAKPVVPSEEWVVWCLAGNAGLARTRGRTCARIGEKTQSMLACANPGGLTAGFLKVSSMGVEKHLCLVVPGCGRYGEEPLREAFNNVDVRCPAMRTHTNNLLNLTVCNLDTS